MSIAAKRSHRGDDFQIQVATHWIVRLLSDEQILFVQVDTVALPDAPEAVTVDDIVIRYMRVRLAASKQLT